MIHKIAQSTVEIIDNISVTTIIGDFSRENAIELSRIYLSYDHKNMLVDLTQAGTIHNDCHKIMAKADLENPNYYERIAFYGITEWQTKLFFKIALLFSHRNNIKLFKSKEEALKWLD